MLLTAQHQVCNELVDDLNNIDGYACRWYYAGKHINVHASLGRPNGQ